MVRVLISDKMSPMAAKCFTQRGIEVDEKPGLSKDELLEIIADYDGLAVRSATKVTGKLLAAAKKLKVVGRAGIGTDNIDIPAATARGVAVMNTPFGNAITTAEHTIAMILSTARQIPAADASTRAGKWEKSAFMGVEVSGKILGIIGCGNIGAVVADRAQGLKMKVLAYDPFLTPERADDLNVKKVELEALFAEADFVSLHTPLTDATRGIIDAAAIAKMKDGVRIINCARGGLVDEEALAEALESGKVAGAAFDVFSEEPATENVLFDAPNMVATPHLGAATTEAQVNVAIQVAEQMADYLLTGAVTNALNMPSVSAEDAPRLKPYMSLAKDIGSFAGQVIESGLQSVTVEYEGHVAELNTRPLTAIVLQGLLRPMMDSVNMVNAPVIAKERNIEVTEVVHDREGDYQTLITLTVITENRKRVVAGTLFANGAPRIVRLDGVELEAELRPHMIFVVNDDEPGLIGALGTMLGEEGINIATFNLGREKKKKRAIALISVDQKVSPEFIERVARLDQVRQAKALAF
ncbi:MAG: phosphoglycerate dehydrogenase [Proteobacteria bacterium]|nr:phosphoglycerate dehydrogenase [Pseudomonadota bacterium]